MHKAILLAVVLTCSSTSVGGGRHHHHHSLPPTAEAICDAAGVDANSCQDYIDDAGGDADPGQQPKMQAYRTRATRTALTTMIIKELYVLEFDIYPSRTGSEFVIVISTLENDCAWIDGPGSSVISGRLSVAGRGTTSTSTREG